MNEVKTPKKPLIFYYVMVFLLLMMLNFMAIPWMAERQVREVDYGTFMTMTEDKRLQKSRSMRVRSSLRTRMEIFTRRVR